MPAASRVVVIGGYTSESGGRAAGLTAFAESVHGGLDEISTLPLLSPSYVIGHSDRPWLFAVSEGSPSLVSSVRLDRDGTLTLINSVDSGGELGCHLALAQDGRHLVVAHYGSGSVASLKIGADGRLSERRDLWQFTGSGPNTERQDGPHAHQVVVHDEVLLVPDLGTDRVHQLRLDAGGQFSIAAPPVELPPGSGPRHLVLAGDQLVVACELSNELWLGVRDGVGWRQAKTVPASLAQVEEPVAPSALRLDGRAVFVANRGPGTITEFSLQLDPPDLVRVHEFDCGGPGPRDLVLEPSRVWVANQTTDVVSVFDRSTSGAPRPAFQLSAATPACIVLLGDVGAR
jgi:6-phosphogluconolactonase